MTRGGNESGDVDELARLQAALRASGDVAYDWDLASDSITWHGSTERLFGSASPGALPRSGEAFAAAIHVEDLPQRARCLNDHLALGGLYDCEYRVISADESFHWVHDRGALIAGPGGDTHRVVGTLRLVTTRKETEARLEYLANFDELTGHFNKSRLQTALDAALRSAQTNGNSGGYAVFGVDQLAMINGAYGYEAGDAVLIEVGRRLGQCVRDSDVVGRVAGDRFGAVLAKCDEGAAQLAAERAVEAIHSTPIATPAGEVRITVTAGVVTFPDQAQSSADVMAKAEGTLREAKHHGRNQTGLYEVSEEQRAAYRAALDIGAEVEDAMREDRLIFAYQPIVWAQDATPHSYECLLRMQRRDGSLLSAGHFIPAVEQLGLMRSLDRQVLRVALDKLAADRRATLAVNISGLTASDTAWLEILNEGLSAAPGVASRLIVEITETAALQDIAETARFVRAVRELGCNVAVDDFGAGFTNFQHLKTLTVDIVKIDGSFIRNIAEDSKNRLFVRNLIALAQSLDLLCIAECVETAAEARVLAEEGAHLLQGFYFARPSIIPPWRRGAHLRFQEMPAASCQNLRRV